MDLIILTILGEEHQSWTASPICYFRSL